MIIGDSKSINEIQQEFNDSFPYLKIEFYKKSHKTGEGSPVHETLNSNLTIQEASENLHKGELKIFEEMQVCELEQQFEAVFSLHVQVWRKSGNLWLQTISTDAWSLKSQNEHGKQSMQGQNA